MATKDKLVNLEDLKVVNDDLQGKVEDLESAITNTPFAGIEFTVPVGTEHSSAKDKLFVNVKTGDNYRIIQAGGGTLYAFRPNGTVISGVAPKTGTAAEDIGAFGVYYNNRSGSADVVIRMTLAANPMGADIYDSVERTNENAVNLVNLANKTGQICEYISFEDETPIQFNTSGYYYTLSGSSVTMENGVPKTSGTDNNYKSGYVACSEGDEFTVNLIGGVGARAYAFVQSTGAIIEKSGESANLSNYIIKAPANSAFLILQTKGDKTSFRGVSIASNIATLNADNSTNKSSIAGIQECKPVNINAVFEQGGIYPNSGNPYSSSIYIRTGFIPIGGYKTLELQIGTGYFVASRFYDSAKTFIESQPDATGISDIEIKQTYSFARIVLGRTDRQNISVSEASNVQIYLISKLLDRINGNDSAMFGRLISSDSSVLGIAHRGYSYVAPENTPAAFKAAAKAGFTTIETDIRFTADNPPIPVLIHDESVDRTSDGTGNVADKTLEQLKALDFGSWFGSEFASERIMTLAEGVALCKKLGLKMILENKTWAGATTLYTTIADVVKAYEYKDKVMVMYDSASALKNFAGDDALKGVGLVLLQDDIDSEITAKVGLLTAVSENVYVAVNNANVTDAKIAAIMATGAKIIIYTVDNAETIQNMDGAISGVLSNRYNAPVVLYNAAIN